LLLLFGVASAQSSQCVIDIGEYRWNFSSFIGKQLSYTSDFVFTFCTASECGDDSSSLCQLSKQPVSLGLWKDVKWIMDGANRLSGMFIGDSVACAEPRRTNVTIECVDGPPSFVSFRMNGTQSCVYEAVIKVPLAFCPQPTACCAPPTYSATRLSTDGKLYVVQADASGNFIDQNWMGTKRSFLCKPSINKCLQFTDTTCLSSMYRPAPPNCFGTNDPFWKLLATGPLLPNLPITQSAWYARSSGAYIVTMPLGGPTSCVIVGGNPQDTAILFSETPNTTLWELPASCIKQV